MINKKGVMLLGILFLIIFSVSFISADQTLKTITANLLYTSSVNANQNYSIIFLLNAPDKISKIYSFQINVQGDFIANTSIKFFINNGTGIFYCNPTWVSPPINVYNYNIHFECSNYFYNFIGGNITIGFSVNKSASNIQPSLLINYYNNPAGNLIMHGTEYTVGQIGKVWIQLLDSNNSAILNAVCYTDIYTPDGGTLIERATMTNMNHDGIYYYDLNIPITQGVYPAIATCYYTAGQTFNFGTAIGFVNGTLDGGSLNDTHVADGVYMLTTESTVINPRRYWAEVNFTTGPICSNISELLLNGVTFYWTGRWNSNIGNDDMTISVWNYTSNSWKVLNNTVSASGSGIKSVSNSISLINITTAGFVNSTGTGLRLKFNDTTLADTVSTGLDYDYLAVSCDQILNPQWQQVKGSSELHVTSDQDYQINNDNFFVNYTIKTILFNFTNITESYYTGIFINRFTLASGTSNNKTETISYSPFGSLPCNSILSFYEIINNSYYPIYNFTSMAATTSGTCYLTFSSNLTKGGNHNYEVHARNTFESEIRSTNTGVGAIYPLINSGCLLWQLSHGLPNYITPKNQTNTQYDYYYRACSNWYDDYYWFNITYATSLNDKNNITDLADYLNYQGDYYSLKFAEDKLNVLTELLLNNLEAVASYSKLLIDNPLGGLVNVTDQQYFANYSTMYENWKLLNLSCYGGKCHVNGTDVWTYYNRSLTELNVNATVIVNTTAIAQEVWAFNGTVNSNLLNQFSQSVWTYTGSIVTINNQIAQNVWNYSARYIHGTTLT